MAKDTGSQIVAQRSMPPPAPRPPRPKVTVLEEDDWTEKLEAIIQRDYFPDVPKLENKLEWLRAVKTQDPVQIRQAQLNIQRRRAGFKTPIGATPGTFATPGASWRGTPGFGQTPGATPGYTPGPGAAAGRGDVGLEEARPSGPPPMRLDKFLAKHTSEDNAAFQEIMDGENKRRAKRHPWLYGNGDNDVPRLEAARSTDGYGTTGQPDDNLIMWPYTPANALYYDSSQRPDAPRTDKEMAAMVQGAPKEINVRGTRFIGTGAPGDAPDPEVFEGPRNAVEAVAAHHEAAFPRLATPSFTPGVEDSPFMTWGDLEGTPLRLDHEETPIPSGPVDGPQFRISEVPKRDKLGRDLSVKATVSLKRKAQLRGITPLGGLARRPLSGLGVGATPRLTPAGRKLATQLRGKAPDTDMQLRASYAGTPGRVTPGHRRAAPGVARTPSHTPRLTPARGKAGTGDIPAPAPKAEHLTDNLLDL